MKPLRNGFTMEEYQERHKRVLRRNNLIEKLKVVQAYSEFESMRFRGQTGMAILRKLYPWLDDLESTRDLMRAWGAEE
jgi:hypothetical protein